MKCLIYFFNNYNIIHIKKTNYISVLYNQYKAAYACSLYITSKSLNLSKHYTEASLLYWNCMTTHEMKKLDMLSYESGSRIICKYDGGHEQ